MLRLLKSPHKNERNFVGGVQSKNFPQGIKKAVVRVFRWRVAMKKRGKEMGSEGGISNER